MKRVLLIFGIVCLCSFVAISGNVALINSKSVLKHQSISKIPQPNYRIFVDITENRLYLINNEKTVKSYPISAGKWRTPSPIGTWKIVQKARWNKGFGGYFMGIDVPWGKYGIHGTIQPQYIGSSMSEGCVRMFNDDVGELYRIIPIGTIVTIYGGPYGPFGSGYRTIFSGDRGADVYEVEKKLKEQGYFKGNVDGIYDGILRTAVHKFQKANKLKVSDTLGTEFYEKLGISLMD